MNQWRFYEQATKSCDVGGHFGHRRDGSLSSLGGYAGLRGAPLQMARALLVALGAAGRQKDVRHKRSSAPRDRE